MREDRRGWFERLFPKMRDFGSLLAGQAAQAEQALEELAAMIGEGGVDVGRLEELEEEAAALRQGNAHALNEAFATPFDREDIQHAIEELDWIVAHTMSTGREMAVLEVVADDVITELLAIVIEGAAALREGYENVQRQPERTAQSIEKARLTDRRARRRYERGLASLFETSDAIHILRHREIYHHLKDAAKRVFKSAVVLEAIHVKNV